MKQDSNLTTDDLKYMRRAIEIARLGLQNVAPNPHVGAVIVADGRIIGEGFHRQCGKPHAEVNAVSSVKKEDLHLLSESTIYVTLEPCSHYGKTPPCAKLIIDNHIPRVVIGTSDPNPKVNGKGIEMLREAGVCVVETYGEIADECRQLDPKFMSKFINHRPFVALKWAQSADGFMAFKDGRPLIVSTPLTSSLMHKFRSEFDGILTTSATIIADNPKMDTRKFPGDRQPRKIIVDRKGVVPPNADIFVNNPTPPLYITSNPRPGFVEETGVKIILNDNFSPEKILKIASDNNIDSILVETGPTLLNEFIKTDNWDLIRCEISDFCIHEQGGFCAPPLPIRGKTEILNAGSNTIITVERK